MTFHCREIQTQDTQSVLRLLMAEETPDRYEIVEQGIIEAIGHATGETITWLIERNQELHGAVLIRDIGGHAGLIVAARIRAEKEREVDVAQSLWQTIQPP